MSRLRALSFQCLGFPAKPVFDDVIRRMAQTCTLFLPVFLVAGRAVADGAAVAAALLFLLHSLKNRDWSWLDEPWVRLTFLLWIWLLASSVINGINASSLTRAAAWIRFPVFVAAMAFWIVDRAWLRRFAAVCGLTLWFVAWDALLQYFTGHDIFGFFAYDDRLTGPFGKDKQVGIFITKLVFLCSLPLLVFAAQTKSKGKTAAVGGFVLFMFMTVFLSGERMATLLFGLGMGLMLLALPALRRFVLWMVFFALVAVGALAAAFSGVADRHISQTHETVSNFAESPYGRVWANGLRVIAENPVFGTGPKNFRYACTCQGKPVCGADEIPCMLHPHNIYIEWAAEAGFVGLAGFLVLLALWFGKFRQAMRAKTSSPYVLGGWVTVAINVWPLSSTGSFFSNWYEVLFWLAVSIALVADGKGGPNRHETTTLTA